MESKPDGQSPTSTPPTGRSISGDDHTSRNEISDVLVDSNVEESNVAMEDFDGSGADSVLGQVSNATDEDGGSLDDQAKQLVQDSLDRLNVSSPLELPAEELGKLEDDVQGLLFGALTVLKEEERVGSEPSNPELAAQWFEEALSAPHYNSVLPTSDYFTPRSAAVNFQEEPSEVAPVMLVRSFSAMHVRSSSAHSENVIPEQYRPCPRPGSERFEFLRERFEDFPLPSSGSISEESLIVTDTKPVKTSPIAELARVIENSVTVKFHLSDAAIYTSAYKIHHNIKEVRESLADQLQIPAAVINVCKDHLKLDDSLQLAGLGVEPYGTLELALESADPLRYPITCRHSEGLMCDSTTAQVPDVINVMVERGDNCYSEVAVEIWDYSGDKPWCGGFREKNSNREFHNAFTQTHPFTKSHLPDDKIHRDTQTADWLNKVQNTPSDKAVQSVRRDFYIPSVDDKIVVARTYVTFDEIEEKRNVLAKVITIQRYVRGWLVRRMIKSKSNEYREQLEWEAMEAKKREKQVNCETKAHVTRQIFPQTRADFEMLYNLVERWRSAEVKRISAVKTDAPRRAELCYLLEKEIVLLNSIEHHRMRLKKEKLKKKEIDFIEKSAKPVQWTGKDGAMISMDTIRTQRARELKQMYASICERCITVEERVNTLISLKHALKTYDVSARIAEIIKLLDRECDCLIRGFTDRHLDLLRERITASFVDLFKDSIFTAEVTRNMPAQEYTPLDISRHYRCERCGKFHPLSKFVKTTVSKSLRLCTSCNWLENIANRRIELAPFQHIVRALRRDEEKRCCVSSFAFVMQDEDFYHLINNIWHSHSVVSESMDMARLRLSRWNVAEEWAPWNCVLLTVEEMEAHLNMPNLSDVYEDGFIHDVKLKHHLARNYFDHLERMDITFRESGSWYNPDVTIKYEPPPFDLDRL